jgi:peptide/nickel transport system permease protein
LTRLRFFVRRFALAVPTILFIVVANFVLLHLAPGDAAEVLAGEAGSATPEMVAQLRQKFGLDQPYHVQLARYLGNTLRLDLGYSQRHGMPVAELIAKRLPATLLL